jgi:hypothetical protein
MSQDIEDTVNPRQVTVFLALGRVAASTHSQAVTQARELGLLDG